MKSIESPYNPEKQEKYSSKIALSFFRHSEKESNDSKSDLDIELTPAGKKQSLEKDGAENIEQAIAFGSPRVRTQETAGFVMLDEQEEITGEETLEELKEKLDDGFAKGSKIVVDKRLDFEIDLNSAFGEVALKYFKNGEYLKFLVEQSDELARQTRDETSSTYSLGASNIAKIISKYVTVSNRWDELVHDESKNYSDTLERFFGTHQSIGEAFLAKVIEDRKGVEERDRFVQILNNQGFDLTEGFTVDILHTEAETPEIRLQYKKIEPGEDGEPKTVFELDERLSLEQLENLIIE